MWLAKEFFLILSLQKRLQAVRESTGGNRPVIITANVAISNSSWRRKCQCSFILQWFKQMLIRYWTVSRRCLPPPLWHQCRNLWMSTLSEMVYNEFDTMAWKNLIIPMTAMHAATHISTGVSNTRPAGHMRPAKLFCAAHGHVHELKNILDKNYLYYPFH